MALAIEVLGLSPVGYATIPAEDPRKDEATRGRRCARGRAAPRRPATAPDIVTRASFENAIAAVAATGGSTNAVLHLLALAREAGIPLAIDDFDRVSRRTPLLADLKPGGRYVAVDMDRAGGVPLLVSAPARCREARRRGAGRRRPALVGPCGRAPGRRRASEWCDR